MYIFRLYLHAHMYKLHKYMQRTDIYVHACLHACIQTKHTHKYTQAHKHTILTHSLTHVCIHAHVHTEHQALDTV